MYVDGAKIAALGLRIKKGKSYHGLSFNIAMDLEPFSRINPCGYEGMPVTQLADLKPGLDKAQIQQQLVRHLTTILGYNSVQY